MTDRSAPAGGLWLSTFQRIVMVASHDIKNTMNGVAVNLEVVRSRVAKETVTPGAVAPFANIAAQQLEQLTITTEALLHLARSVPSPIDIGAVLRQLEALVGHLSQSDRAQVTVTVANAAITHVASDTVRLILGAAVLSALDSPALVRCTVTAMPDAKIRVRFEGARPLHLGADVEAAAREAGIDLTLVEGSTAITFPVSAANG